MADEEIVDLVIADEEFLPEVEVAEVQPFVSFPCEECQTTLSLQTSLYPGQAGVIVCPNCSNSFTVYNPSLVINKTKEVTEEAQDVWRQLSAE